MSRSLTAVAVVLTLQSCSRFPPGLLRTTPVDSSRATSAHRVLVFTEAMSANEGGPSFVTLDSGVVYRVFFYGDADVVLSARDQRLPPPVAAPILFGEEAVTRTAAYRLVLEARPAMRFVQGTIGQRPGIPFQILASGEYRIETSPGPLTGDSRLATPIGDDASVLVRIYREDADNLSALCVADPHAYGCRHADELSSRPSSRLGTLGVIATFLIPLAAWALGPH